MELKHIQVFESFTKTYDEKVKVQDFESLKIGQTVQYKGTRYKIKDRTKSSLDLETTDGKKAKVNYKMFNDSCAIPKS